MAAADTESTASALARANAPASSADGPKTWASPAVNHRVCATEMRAIESQSGHRLSPAPACASRAQSDDLMTAVARRAQNRRPDEPGGARDHNSGHQQPLTPLEHTPIVGDYLLERKAIFGGPPRPGSHLAESIGVPPRRANDGQQTIDIAGSNDPAGVDFANDAAPPPIPLR